MHARLTIILALLLLAAPALAVQRESNVQLPGDFLALSTADGIQAGGAPKSGQRGSDYLLGKSLELPASDLFSLENDLPLRNDFELRLPEESLPESDIPLALNGKVEYFVRYFQTRARGVFARWLSRSERYIPMMREVLKKEGLPEDLVYLAMIESGFAPHAYSVASAVGPWQFMSSTGRRYSLRIDPWIDERRDPLKSTIAAALYLKELYALFNNDWYLAAAGYNAGENKILRAIDKYNSRDFWQLSKGSYLKRETKDYVPKLLAAAIIAKEPARYGFADVAYLPGLELDTVTVPARTDLEVIARITGVPSLVLKELNPELRRGCTPPDYPNYQLKLPKGKMALFEAEYANIPEGERYTERLIFTRYRAKRQDTLVAIARRFNTSEATLAELNHLRKGAKLRGRQLLVPVQVATTPPAGSESAPTAQETPGAATVGSNLTTWYTVKKGDTLRSLARRFNVSAKILTAWNNLKGKMALRPGKRIIVAKQSLENSGAQADDNS